MIRIAISAEQVDYALDLVDKCNFGQRGKFDGDKSKQLVGMLAQTVLADYIGHPRPKHSQGFDGGYDYIINDKKVDVKCMARRGHMCGSFVHNLIAYQKDYDVDYYIFTNLVKSTNELEVCGVISKDDFFKSANFYREGAIRNCGFTKFALDAPLYELKQYRLHILGNVESKDDIFMTIR